MKIKVDGIKSIMKKGRKPKNTKSITRNIRKNIMQKTEMKFSEK